LANLSGRTIAFLPRLGDVDSAEAYGLYARHVGRRLLPRL